MARESILHALSACQLSKSNAATHSVWVVKVTVGKMPLPNFTPANEDVPALLLLS